MLNFMLDVLIVIELGLKVFSIGGKKAFASLTPLCHDGSHFLNSKLGFSYDIQTGSGNVIAEKITFSIGVNDFLRLDRNDVFIMS